MNDGAVVSEVMADLRIAAGGIGHDLRVGTDDTADEFSKIRLRVVLQQHGPNGAEPLRSDADELLLRALPRFCLAPSFNPGGPPKNFRLGEHTSELPALMRHLSSLFCLEKTKYTKSTHLKYS